MESEWPQKLRALPVASNNLSAFSSASDSVIDDCLVSQELESWVVGVSLVKGLPWGPHHGLLVSLHGKPRHLQANVFVVCKPFPMKEFHANWELLNTHQKDIAWRKAKRKAKHKLSIQRVQTGVAI